MNFPPAAKMVACGCDCVNREKVVLPFLEHPPIEAYNYMAFFLGSLMASNGSCENFMLNNYLQLSTPAIYNDKHPIAFIPAFGVDDGEILGIADVRTVYPKSGEEIDYVLVSSLHEGYYARVVLDEYYLPGKLSYNKRSFIHDNLIFGYCDLCKSCLMAGYRAEAVANSPMKMAERFGFIVCPIAALAPAIFSRPQGGPPKFLQDRILLFRPRNRRINIDKNFIETQLKSYLAGSGDGRAYLEKGYPLHSFERPGMGKPEIDYGIDSYKSMINISLERANLGTPDFLINYRLFWEHKVCMRRRIEALVGDTDSSLSRALISLSREVENAANMARLMAIRHRIHFCAETADGLANVLRVAHEKERRLLADLLAQVF